MQAHVGVPAGRLGGLSRRLAVLSPTVLAYLAVAKPQRKLPAGASHRSPYPLARTRPPK
jgi:hypothetical protein